jgi:diguanylate cyclase (GGDEF)-like protein
VAASEQGLGLGQYAVADPRLERLLLDDIDRASEPVREQILHPHQIEQVEGRGRIDVNEHVDALAELATHDPLTGLANRRGFGDMLRREWRRCAREEEPLSLLVLDVDNFKGFNDLYGHGRGDECLKIIASAITCSIRRPSDLAARYGGEEFVVVLPTTYLDDAMVIGEAIRQAVVQQAVPHRDGPAGVVSVSIGAACSISLVEPTMELLIETADNALYQAKHNGRNRIECLSDLNTSSVMHDRLTATVS